MRLEIRNAGSRQFAEELMYVISQKKTIAKEHRLKSGNITATYRYYLLLGAFGVVFTIVAYLVFKYLIFILLCGVFAAFLFVYYVSMQKTNRYMDQIIADRGTRVIELKEDEISFTDNVKTVNYSWNDVLAVVVGQYSITVIPTADNELAIGIDIQHKDDIVSFLDANNLNKLLINLR